MTTINLNPMNLSCFLETISFPLCCSRGYEQLSRECNTSITRSNECLSNCIEKRELKEKLFVFFSCYCFVKLVRKPIGIDLYNVVSFEKKPTLLLSVVYVIIFAHNIRFLLLVLVFIFGYSNLLTLFLVSAYKNTEWQACDRLFIYSFSLQG